MSKRVFAIHAHPDDIEFMMAGTLLLLKQQGCDIHYMNIANGSCGSMEYPPEEIIPIREKESREAAEFLGATYHPSLVNDIEIFYEKSLLSKLAAVIREVSPDIVLTASPQDYMEDHMNACRLTVTAAFVRSMPNFDTDPPTAISQNDVTLYHANPHGLRDGLRHFIMPEFTVDIDSVIELKSKMLACHKTQKEWLDRTQGLESYITAMKDMSEEVGGLSAKAKFAEGWRRHSHLGFSRSEVDPLSDLLRDYIITQ